MNIKPFAPALISLGLIISAFSPAWANPAYGPHISPAQYSEQREGFNGPAWEVTFEHQIEDLAGEPVSESETLTLTLGPDYALSGALEGAWTLLDFAQTRQLSQQEGADSIENTSFYGDVRRRVETYARFSQNGQRDMIPFGPELSFHRFWLEAAMGVRAQPVTLEAQIEDETHRLLHQNQIIADIEFASPAQLADFDPAAFESFILWAQHSQTLHPDVLAYIQKDGRLPARLSFAVFSPDSPDGRREVLRFESLTPRTAPLTPFIEEANFERPFEGEMEDLVLAVARGELSFQPTPDQYLAEIQETLSQDRPAQALLISEQERFHYGPCPEQSIGSARVACGMTRTIEQAGVGRAEFEALHSLIQRLGQTQSQELIDVLTPFMTVEGSVSAAAHLIYANEMARLTQANPSLNDTLELSPLSAFETAILEDPMAGDSYWYLAQYMIAQGQYDMGWQVLDMARAGVQIVNTPSLTQVERIETSLEGLAPGFFLKNEENLQISE